MPQLYDEAASAGNRYEGGELTLNDVTAPRMDGAEAAMSFGVRQEAVSLLGPDATVVDQGYPVQENVISGITLIFSDADQSWLVDGFNLGA